MRGVNSEFMVTHVLIKAIMSADQNLSDLACHVCNTWVSIYNLIQDWNKEHVEGLRIITEFINTKLEILRKKQTTSFHSVICNGSTYSRRCYTMDAFSRDLKEVINNMNKHVAQMDNCSRILWNINETDRMRKETCPDELPLFRVQTVTNIYNAAAEVSKAYADETSMKQSIVEAVLSESEERRLRYHHYVWKRNVYITRDSQFKLEVMLESCGIKK